MIFLGPEDTQETWGEGWRSPEEATSLQGAPRAGCAPGLWAPRGSPNPNSSTINPKYSPYVRGHTKNTFPPPQAFVPVRSHLRPFSGDLPEGDLITEGLYINPAALPMKRE